MKRNLLTNLEEPRPASAKVGANRLGWMRILMGVVFVVGIGGIVSGQQVIGSFTYMNGGFEGQTPGALGTAVSTTLWSRQSQAGASSSIVTTSPRSGVNYASVTNVATASRGLQSPQSATTSNGPAINTSYVVQFFVKNASSVNAFQGGVTINGTANPTYSTAATLSANASWTKVTYVLTTQNTTLTSCGIGIAGRSQAGVFDIDDYVVYLGSAADVTAPNSPGTVTVNNATNSSLDVSWSAASGGVDGGGYLVVRYSTSPNVDNDPNQNGIYAVGNTHTNGTGSLVGTICYIGTGTSFTDAGLSSATTYYYKVYTVDKAFNYSSESSGNGTTLGGSTPTITVTPTTLTGFTYVEGSGPSAEQNFTCSGTNLTANISIAPPTNYEISTGTGGSFVATNPITLTQSGGTVANTTIYVRQKAGLSAGTYGPENITASSTGATNKTVTCDGTVTSISPTITVSPTTLTGFTYIEGSGPSGEQTFSCSGTNLTADISIAPSTNYEISTSSGSGFGASLTLTQSGGTVVATTIYVRLKSGLVVGTYNAEVITASSTSATNKTITCSGSVSSVLSTCGSESCANLCTATCTPSSSTYGTRSWAGDNGVTWTATDSRSDQTLTGKAITIRTGTLTSGTFSGGIGSLTVSTKLPFADAGSSLTLLVNGASVGTIPYSTTAQTTTISNINVTGNIVIQFSNSNSQRPTIDDISWTCYAPCAAPTITTQPVSQSVCLTNPVSFTVAGTCATGALSYQWQKNGVDISGATSATYTIASAAAGDAANYTCIVGCVCGSTPTTVSSVAALTVSGAAPSTPVGSITPAANPACGSTTLSYSAPSASIFWQNSATGISTTNPTTASYTITATGVYYVRSYNGSCWSSGSLASSSITVNPAVSISTQPANATVPETSSATFSILATNASGYQWQLNTGSGWNNIGGATSSSYSTGATTLAMSGYQYRCIVTGNAPCGTITSNAATLTVMSGSVWLIDEDFDATTGTANLGATTVGPFTTLGSGWFTASTTVGSRGKNCLFMSNDETLYTPTFANGDLLCFWMGHAVGNVTATMQIEVTTDNGANWAELANITLIPAQPRFYFYPISTSVDQIRFNYSDGNNNDIFFDDVMVRSSGFCSATPLIEKVLVNSCAETDEGINEFVLVDVDQAINVDDLLITFPSADPGTYSFCTDCDKTFTTNSAYTQEMNDTAGCTIAYDVVPGGVIPANSKLIIFTGASPEFTYDLSDACGGQPYYVLYCNNANISGRFANSPGGTAYKYRYVSIIDQGSGCYDQVFYDENIPNTDGEYAAYDLASRAMTYGNNGCTEAIVSLPVELLYFTSVCSDEKVQIAWSTATETNNAYFTIEAADAANGDFVPVVKVNGAGNSNEVLDYSVDVVSSAKYFRLKQTDYDGKFTYSDVIAVDCEDNQVQLFPTIALEGESISIIGEVSSVRVFDSMGREVRPEIIDNKVCCLEAGMYFFVINGKWNHKVVVQ